MSTYLTTRAIILQEEPFRERDIQYSILTEHEGVQHTVVRGGRMIQSKLRPHVLRFDRSLVTLVRTGSRSYISHAMLEERIRVDGALATRYRAAAVACSLARIARPDASDHEDLFRLLNQCLISLNQRESQFLSSLFPVIAGTLIVSGVRPQVERCGSCRRQVHPHDECLFSMAHGSVFHHTCAHPEGIQEFSAPLLLGARSVFSGVTPQQPQHIFSFLVGFLKYHLEPKK